MTRASEWRLSVARHLAAQYSERSGVEAFIVGGSVSRGTADGYSDLEVGVFWVNKPSDALRRDCLKALDGEVIQFRSYEGDTHDAPNEGGEEFFVLRQPGIAGLKIDIHHRTSSSVLRLMDDVLAKGSPQVEKQELLSTLIFALALKGESLISTWKARLSIYPSILAQAVVREYLKFNPYFGPRMLIDREGMFLERVAILTAYQRRLLCVLMGLNRVFHRGDYKWLTEVEARLTLRPPNLVKRLARVFEVGPDEGWQEMARLIDETCALVEIHMPSIDTSTARRWFVTSRPWLEGPLE